MILKQHHFTYKTGVYLGKSYGQKNNKYICDMIKEFDFQFESQNIVRIVDSA